MSEDDVLAQILQAACDLSGASGAALDVLGPDGAVLATVLRHLDPGAAGHPFTVVPITHGGQLVATVRLGVSEIAVRDRQGVQALANTAAMALTAEREHRESLKRSGWLAASTEVTTALLAGQDAEDVLDLIARRSASVVGADAVALVLEGIDADWVLELAHGDAALVDLIGTPMPEQGRTRQVLANGHGLIENDFAHAERVLVPGLRAFGPALYTPLIDAESPVGVLILLRHLGGDYFEPADLRAAEDFARTAALTVHLAEARQAHAQADLLNERSRIARDLHDLVVQELFALGMSLAKLRREVPASAATQLERSLQVLDGAVREIRTTIRALRDPDGGATASLLERLHQEADAAIPMLGFAPRILTPDATSAVSITLLSPEQGDDIVAVVREALSNAARHARASEVRVQLQQRDETFTVLVSDNGVGLPSRLGRRSGLNNLQERARRYAGSSEAIGVGIDDGPGTTVRWSVPAPTRS